MIPLAKLKVCSDNDKLLPSHGMMRKNGHEFLFKEVIKRHDSLKDFAEKYNLITAYEARKKKVKQQLTS